MSQSASQAAQFYRDVAQSGALWTIQDDGGFPAPMTTSGQRAQPFWSTRTRVEKIIATVPAYAGFEAVEVSWDEFKSKWAPGLEKDGLLVGVNWSGPKAVGYDLPPLKVCDNIQMLLDDTVRRPWWARFNRKGRL